MRDRYSNGERISDPADHADLCGLIERYDRTLDKAGEPTKSQGQMISHFERRLNTSLGWSTEGFWLIREDGSGTDFSFLRAAEGKVNGPSRDFCNAARHAIRLDTILAKKRHFDKYGDEFGRVECELTGVMVTNSESHLDHVWPFFGQLVVGFRAARGWSEEIPNGVISWPSDGQLTAVFQDPSVEEAFRKFHHAQAITRIVSKQANLSNASLASLPKINRPINFVKA
jgi:hypothetical protein